ncbi:MAG: M1 family metallopeptidase [Proteobacteria bacterium]|nr:M1 family metallopeptidase [Pseudomonadota bacterium]
MARRDPHSYADDAQVETASFALTASVDFATRTITGEVTLTFKAPGRGPLDLDTRDLTIERVVDATGRVLPFVLHPPEAYVGARLAIELTDATPSITIRYHTSPEASALQWLTPAQTRGGVQPYLFSQCQAIHTRSLVPVQDTPRLRVRYTAALTVPSELVAVMAAADRGKTVDGARTTYRFEMPQAIPPYLFAFAVGDLASRELSARCRVWAEPAVVDAAAYEFADVEAMITAAEALFGPYDWERFDILTMPPSFPYGGMENPRLTFLTPTLLAGDRSLVSVVAHELAHSWTGNLVTNANAEHFWLNEGFTMYAERRITEALDGADLASLSAALGRRELDESIARFADRPAMTKLRTHLEGIDPDECYSLIPYEKGYFFLCAIEAHVGRPAFSAWLRTYLDTFRFGAITTEDFEAHLEAGLPGALAAVDARQWIDGEGIPASAAAPRSSKLDAIEALAGGVPARDVGEAWSATEWSLYLETVPRPAAEATCRALADDHGLTASHNYDVLVGWLTLALQSGYLAVVPRALQVVADVGRMKYLRPLYTALAADPRTRDQAIAAYAQHRDAYHPIARSMVESVLAKNASSASQ